MSPGGGKLKSSGSQRPETGGASHLTSTNKRSPVAPQLLPSTSTPATTLQEERSRTLGSALALTSCLSRR